MMNKKISKLFKVIPSAAGFTLVELLVVIGILGIMAAALIATIDPFEQIKKAQDTNLKNIAVEFHNATTRYYTNHNALPWYTVANGGAACYSTATFTSLPLSSMTTCINALVSDGELKQGFSTTSNLNKITATNPNPLTSASTDTSLCFLPTSKAQQKDPNTKYAINGAAATNCKSTGGTANCYWCAQ